MKEKKIRIIIMKYMNILNIKNYDKDKELKTDKGHTSKNFQIKEINLEIIYVPNN